MKDINLKSPGVKNFTIYLLPSFVFLALVIGFNFNGLYGQDSHEYYRYTKDLLNFFNGGQKPAELYWPVFYPLSGSILSVIFFNPLFSLQLLSFLSFLFSIFFLKKILELIYPDAGNYISVFLTVGYSLAPFVILYSLVIMSDLLCLLLITAAFYFYLKYTAEAGYKYFLLFVLFTTASVMTRYAAAIIMLTPVVLLLIKFIKNFRFTVLAGSTVIILILLTVHFYLKPVTGSSLDNVLVRNWDILNLFRDSFSFDEGLFKYSVPNIIYAFSNFAHPYFIFGGIVFLPFLRLKDFKTSAVLTSLFMIIIYAMFIGGIPMQNKRFLLLTFPFVLIVIYKTFQRVMGFIKSTKFRIVFTMIIALIQLMIFAFAISSIYKLNRIEKEISASVLNYSNEFVYTFFIDPALRSYNVDKEIINLRSERINFFKKNGLVLFNESKFREQFQNKAPMINWNKLKSDYNLSKLEVFEDGWELYEIR